MTDAMANSDSAAGRASATTRDGSEAILRTETLHKYFGGLHAVDGVSITIPRSKVLSVIGPNGAGKTTLFNLITGVYAPTKGTVEFIQEGDWIELTGRPTHAIADLGVVRTFQNVRPFGELTVQENVLAGIGHDRYRSFRMFGRYARADQLERADALLARVGLQGYGETRGKDLPLALQRRLEIARALALEPTVLLLDEPAAGLTDEESRQLMTLLRELVADGLTVVLIEHSMPVVMNVSDRIYVLDQGAVIAEGEPEAIQQDERVAEAYLGRPGEGGAMGRELANGYQSADDSMTGGDDDGDT